MAEEENKEALAPQKKTKMKPRGGNSPVIGDNGVHTKPGDNSRFARTLLTLYSWGEVDKSDVDALETRFWDFVDYCEKNDVRITNQLAYYAIGISKDDAYNWEHGVSRTKAHCDFIKKIKRFCSAYREMLGADGKLNPVTLVWWQKNYDGMKDQTEVIITPNNPLGDDDRTAKELAEKYAETIPPIEARFDVVEQAQKNRASRIITDAVKGEEVI